MSEFEEVTDEDEIRDMEDAIIAASLKRTAEKVGKEDWEERRANLPSNKEHNPDGRAHDPDMCEFESDVPLGVPEMEEGTVSEGVPVFGKTGARVKSVIAVGIWAKLSTLACKEPAVLSNGDQVTFLTRKTHELYLLTNRTVKIRKRGVYKYGETPHVYVPLEGIKYFTVLTESRKQDERLSADTKAPY